VSYITATTPPAIAAVARTGVAIRTGRRPTQRRRGIDSCGNALEIANTPISANARMKRIRAMKPR